MEYRPLGSEHCEIRLLTLLEGDHSPMVSCRLDHYSLIDPPPYTALSYCWGKPDITKTIIVNDVKVQVTVNLEAALRQLQAHGYEKIWVDAVCINQEDREEKSLQVLRMTSIYSQATSVVVWLGIEREDSNKAMAYIEHLSDHPLSCTLSSYGCYKGVPIAGADPKALAHIIRKNAPTLKPGSPQVVSKEHLDAFMAFFQRPYWRRIWIIQEVVAAAKVTVYCGARSTELEYIENALAKTVEGQQFVGSGHVPNFQEFRKSPVQGKSNPLVRLLMTTRASNSSEPRDKVYALLGMASDGRNLVPLPNYMQPADSVFRELTKSILIMERFPNILLLRSIGRGPNDRLPSWVPDWPNLLQIYRPWHSALLCDDTDHSTLLAKMSDVFKALVAAWEGGSAGLEHVAGRPPIDFDAGILKMKGVRHDRVDGLSTQMKDDESIMESERAHRKMIQSRDYRTRYNNGQEILKAITYSLAMAGIEARISGKDLELHEPLQSVTDLFTEIGREILAKSYPELFKWLAGNSLFLIDGRKLEDWMEPSIIQNLEDIALEAMDSRFVSRLEDLIARISQVVECGMRLITTTHGRVGMVHAQTRPGDEIWTLVGCGMPVVLRRSGDYYHIVGEAYLHPIKQFTGNLDATELSALNDVAKDILIE